MDVLTQGYLTENERFIKMRRLILVGVLRA
jgi:hypothetical protein